ncbi:MAG TPA: hypothetical protein VMW07_01770 [Gallionella sp.]|nr:hypothetical protein [Gallionella sp.]
MHASVFTIPFALWLGLNACAVQAQELVTPDQPQLQPMSVEEYEAYREQLQNRMKNTASPERAAVSEPVAPERRQPEPAQVEKRDSGSGYGRGYGTRDGQSGMQGRQGGGYGRGGGGGRRR